MPTVPDTVGIFGHELGSVKRKSKSKIERVMEGRRPYEELLKFIPAFVKQI